VRIQPGNLLLHAEKGIALRDLLLREGILMDFPCGGRGRCGQCRVRIDPAPETGKGKEGLLSPKELKEGTRLACEAVLVADSSVTIPEGKTTGGAWKGASKLEETHLGIEDPIVTRRSLRVPPPSLEDQTADWERTRGALAAEGLSVGDPDLTALEQLARNTRAGKGDLHLIMEDGSVLCSCACETCDCRYYGFAVDLGTTTVDVALYNLETGRRVARNTLLNRQTAFGADVISRAQAFGNDRRAVRKAALETIEEAALETLRRAAVSPESVVRSVVVGNPIMMHILHDLDPLQLTLSPYVPIISGMARRKPVDFGWSFQRFGWVETLPLISAFVGADTVGMIVALGLGHREDHETTLSVDIGTNGELVLARGGRLYSTSAAAGPAFEGAQIACGCRAVPGAVCGVEIRADGVSLETLENAPPLGICGTSLIMAVSQLLDLGLVEPTGRLLGPGEVREPALRSRLFKANGVLAFALSDDRKVYITQKDIRELQLAKGAIRTAVEVLIEEVGVSWEEIDRVSLAGNFGAGMDIGAEMRIGLFPGKDPAKVDVVGNAALRGAALVLISRAHRKWALEAPRSCTFLELAGRPDFQMRFADSLLF
jgi:uncharacterized 2Fe-2S/4Fe-4S cluster protein (DUF4445 family)